MEHLRDRYERNAWVMVQNYFNMVEDELRQASVHPKEITKLVNDIANHFYFRCDEFFEKEGIITFMDVTEVIKEMGSPEEIVKVVLENPDVYRISKEDKAKKNYPEYQLKAQEYSDEEMEYLLEEAGTDRPIKTEYYDRVSQPPPRSPAGKKEQMKEKIVLSPWKSLILVTYKVIAYLLIFGFLFASFSSYLYYNVMSDIEPFLYVLYLGFLSVDTILTIKLFSRYRLTGREELMELEMVDQADDIFKVFNWMLNKKASETIFTYVILYLMVYEILALISDEWYNYRQEYYLLMVIFVFLLIRAVIFGQNSFLGKLFSSSSKPKDIRHKLYYLAGLIGWFLLVMMISSIIENNISYADFYESGVESIIGGYISLFLILLGVLYLYRNSYYYQDLFYPSFLLIFRLFLLGTLVYSSAKSYIGSLLIIILSALVIEILVELFLLEVCSYKSGLVSLTDVEVERDLDTQQPTVFKLIEDVISVFIGSLQSFVNFLHRPTVNYFYKRIKESTLVAFLLWVNVEMLVILTWVGSDRFDTPNTNYLNSLQFWVFLGAVILMLFASRSLLEVTGNGYFIRNFLYILALWEVTPVLWFVDSLVYYQNPYKLLYAGFLLILTFIYIIKVVEAIISDQPQTVHEVR